MYIAYTDASVKEGYAFLAFVIFFENNMRIKRRIVVNGINDSNIAEALAVSELISFLKNYNFKKGLILLDSNGVKNQLKKKGRKIHNYLPADFKNTLFNLKIRTQVIPRKYNVAHSLCYTGNFSKSSHVSDIKLSRLPDYPDYYMQLSVLEEYRKLYNEPLVTFHKAQWNLNKKIWLNDHVEKLDTVKIYVNQDIRIKVIDDTLVKIWKVNYEDWI